MVGPGKSLPEQLEAELMAIHFEAETTDPTKRFDTLCRDHPQHADALQKRREALVRSERLLGNMRDGLRDLAQAQRIGPYEILRVLGEGGFGTVYLAEQHEPVRRQVALKVLQAGQGDTRSLQRFEDERQVLARLQHACIAQVYDAGVTEERMPFFAMEFVDGTTITEWCSKNEADVDTRLSLFLRVCRAIHHAHQCEIVHRDIKPSNVLVRDEDGAPLPKIIDFGIAKMLEHHGATRAATIQGGLVGTPGYMSPEQAAGEAVDARTDVYSLGVLLCELLTGSQPLAAERLAGASIGAMARILEEAEPRRPSTLLDDKTGPNEHKLRARLREDLDWIVLQAVATARDERYASVAALADDVERHLRGDAVLARQNAGAYALRKFVRRHRLAAAVAATVMLSLVAAVASLSWGLDAATTARSDAEHERDNARARDRASRIAVAQMALASGDVHTAVTNLTDVPEADRGWEWRHLVAQSDTSQHTVEIGADCLDVVWLGDDEVAAFPMFDVPTVWQPSTGKRLRTFEWDGVFRRVAVDRASGEAVLAGDSGIGVWDVTTGKRIRDLGRAPDEVRSLQWSADRTRVVVCGRGKWIEVIDAQTGSRQQRIDTEREINAVAILDDERLVVGSVDGTIEILSASSGQSTGMLIGHQDVVANLLVDGEHKYLYSSSLDGTVRAWRLADREQAAVWRTRARMRQLQLSHDGETLYACGGFGDCVLAAWNTRSFEFSGRFLGHRLGVLAFDIDASGEALVSVSRDGTLRTWASAPPTSGKMLAAGRDARVLSCSHDASAFATASFDGRITVWNAEDLAERTRITTEDVWTGSALTNDTVFAVGQRLCAFDLSNGELRAEGETNGRRVENMLVDPANRWIIGGFVDHVLIWRCSDLTLLHEIELPVAAARLAWDATSSAFVIGGAAATARWLDPATGRILREQRIGNETKPISSLAILGHLLISGTEDILSVRERGNERHRLGTLHISAAISPDGRRLVTGGADQKVRLWDLATGDQLLVFDQPDYPVSGVHFVADGKRIVALSHRWNAPTHVHVFSAPPSVDLRR